MFERSVITNQPPEVVFPDTVDAHANLSPEANATLDAIEERLQALTAEDAMTDEEILGVLHASTATYVGRFEKSCEDAVKFLGQDSKLELPAGTDTTGAAHEPAKPGPGTDNAYAKLMRAVQKECSTVGADPETTERIVRIANERFGAFAPQVASAAQAGMMKFRRLADGFGAPDVLRAEARAAAAKSLAELRDELTKHDRPPADTLFRRLGRLASNDIVMTQAQFDRLAEAQLAKYPEFTMSNLLEAYVQQAMVHYAKQSFGETPFILTRGLNSDDPTLYDKFQQMTTPGKVTRPLLPMEYALWRTTEAIHDVLYSDKSKTSALLDAAATEGQGSYLRDSNKRRSREALRNYSPSEDLYAAFAKEGLFKGVPRDPEAVIAQRVSALRSSYVECYAKYKEALDTMKMTPATRQYLDSMKTDFINRLERPQQDEDEQLAAGVHRPPRTYKRILRRIIRELHPDLNPDNEDGHAFFKLYSVVRDHSIGEMKMSTIDISQ